MKKCNVCQQDKDRKEFYKDAKMNDGLRGNCKECHRKDMIRRQEWIPVGERDGKSDKKICSKVPLNPRKTKEEKFETRRQYHYQSNYGISYEEYLQMYKIQDGKCYICKSEYEKLFVDHCHVKNNVRALLCSQCNFGLGNFKDDIEKLKAAINYLEKFSK